MCKCSIYLGLVFWQRWEQGARLFSQAGELLEQLPSLLTSPAFLFSAIIVSSGVCEALTSRLRVFHETGTNELTCCPRHIHKSQKAHPCCCYNIISIFFFLGFLLFLLTFHLSLISFKTSLSSDVCTPFSLSLLLALWPNALIYLPYNISLPPFWGYKLFERRYNNIQPWHICLSVRSFSSSAAQGRVGGGYFPLLEQRGRLDVITWAKTELGLEFLRQNVLGSFFLPNISPVVSTSAKMICTLVLVSHKFTPCTRKGLN